jgi:hypothetical protein
LIGSRPGHFQSKRKAPANLFAKGPHVVVRMEAVRGGGC